ncbi:uncharacterized protein LOC107021042 [Solanum pennellii]|uniref:Uncharacterized protein LOC107021042 n=1 Tax=Solanum pennellii TaxID=28526 RepID=A0ABM1GWU2_SOLPN|nr:uncharacterized protein LOC107021042 [Solanum pennellii]
MAGACPTSFSPPTTKFPCSIQSTSPDKLTREQGRKENFTPIGESYTSLLWKLIQLRVVEPVNPYVVNPNARGFYLTVICEYHANAPGHSTENCWTLKRVIEKLIEDKLIEVRNEEAPNVTNNPLPAHNNERVVGMVDIFEDYEQTSRTKVESKVSKEESSMVLEPIQRAPIIIKGASSNFGNSRKLVLYVPESIKRVDVPLNGQKFYIPGKFSTFNQNQESMKEPAVIQITAQLPITNTKAVPWNYNKVVITHMGKEIVEETNETRGLTRSGRCYAPEELRRDKQIKENQLPMKKPVTEEDAEEFLKKMKAQDYSVIDQLRKMPAQVSLLSLLIHSKEHREVLTRILNEAHISENITVGHFEKMVNQIFEVNRITFNDDELPLEGSGHNRALHLTVKCEEHYVKRVMVDGGSGVDICPLSTLQSLKINTDRILTNNVCVRAFDGAKRDILGEIYLIVTIGPAEFGITFQVIDMDTSYNLLLGRPWIHMARAVPSTLHQVVKFEHDKQEIIVHGEDDLPITRDPSIPCIEAKRGCESLNYQALEIITVNQFLEGNPILQPRLSSTSVMVVAQMVQNGYEPGKGLGLSLQGILNPISPIGDKDTFGLGFNPTRFDRKWAKDRKRNAWNLSKPIPHIAQSFIKSQGEPCPDLPIQMMWIKCVKVSRKCFKSYVNFNNMTCMRSLQLDPKKFSDLITMNPKSKEYDEDEADEEIKRGLDQFENKPKPNLSETEVFNLGTPEEVKEIKIRIHVDPNIRDDIIQVLIEYKDVFAWSYEDMPGLSADLVVHKLPIHPDFPPVQQKQRKFKTDMSDKIKEEIMKQLNAKVTRVVQYTTWLSNVVPVAKKDGKIRVCVDYRDLNKASPKDNFPLPNIHILVDNCAKHEIQSFMDCYAGYHQILMDEKDTEKIAFTTPWGTYCYRIVPFGIKNAGQPT